MIKSRNITHIQAKPRIVNPSAKNVRDLSAELELRSDFVYDDFWVG